ncbi:MAG: hypothetical protein Q4G49_04630 [Paracoccus sp. (in: a-proteobacteria)]|nr:hypothetical protein [Paracoccus sp. (in: a-proteobacteria)]
MNKNFRPSRKLSFDDAVKIWVMRWGGEIQSRIAATFDVNQGRVSEVLSGKLHPQSEETAKEKNG